MNSISTRFAAAGLAALSFVSAASAQDPAALSFVSAASAQDPAALSFVSAASAQDPAALSFVSAARTQDPAAPTGKAPAAQAPTWESLAEQARYAEEHTRDFDKSAQLFGQASALAQKQGDAPNAKALDDARARVLARKSGIQAGGQEAYDAKRERAMLLIREIGSGDIGESGKSQGYRDLALLGAQVVPWLEKAIDGPFEQDEVSISGESKYFVKAIAMMSAPEGLAAMDRLLSSSDPLVRRAVAEYADPERHRAQLLRALKDPAQGVRERALATLAASDDPALTEVMRAAARGASGDAFEWLARREPSFLVQVAADKASPGTLRERVLNRLIDTEPLALADEHIDALLLLARERGAEGPRVLAMNLVYKLTRTSMSPETAKRIETAVLSDFAHYPRPAVTGVLLRVGGPQALKVLVEQICAGGYPNSAETQQGISRILARCGPADFAAVADAYGKMPPRLPGVLSNDAQVRPPLQGWLGAMLDQGLGSQAIAQAAGSMDPLIRRDFMQDVGLPWISRIPVGMQNATIPSVDPGLLTLLREMPTGASSDYVRAKAIGMGASGDPKVLPELVAMVSPNSNSDGYVQWAIRRVAGKDPQRWRVVIEQLMASESVSTEDLSRSFRELIGERQPTEILGLVKSLWKPAHAEKLAALVLESVPGPEGSAFLLEHYAQLPLVASKVREGIIKRFADEVYQPATALVGEALRDTDDRVRNAAFQAFNRFRENRQLVSDFKAWTEESALGDKTTAELLALLDSSNPQVLVATVKALGALKVRSALPRLIALLEARGNDAALVDAVGDAIERLK